MSPSTGHLGHCRNLYLEQVEPPTLRLRITSSSRSMKCSCFQGQAQPWAGKTAHWLTTPQQASPHMLPQLGLLGTMAGPSSLQGRSHSVQEQLGELGHGGYRPRGTATMPGTTLVSARHQGSTQGCVLATQQGPQRQNTAHEDLMAACSQEPPPRQGLFLAGDTEAGGHSQTEPSRHPEGSPQGSRPPEQPGQGVAVTVTLKGEEQTQGQEHTPP